jgi:hypothetical protein
MVTNSNYELSYAKVKEALDKHESLMRQELLSHSDATARVLKELA